MYKKHLFANPFLCYLKWIYHHDIKVSPVSLNILLVDAVLFLFQPFPNYTCYINGDLSRVVKHRKYS